MFLFQTTPVVYCENMRSELGLIKTQQHHNSGFVDAAIKPKNARQSK